MWVGGGSRWWGSAIRLRDVAEAQMAMWKNSEYMQHRESETKAKELERQEVEVDQRKERGTGLRPPMKSFTVLRPAVGEGARLQVAA